jgi:hypothetical protein
LVYYSALERTRTGRQTNLIFGDSLLLSREFGGIGISRNGLNRFLRGDPESPYKSAEDCSPGVSCRDSSVYALEYLPGVVAFFLQ